jgi:hypothetical protein
LGRAGRRRGERRVGEARREGAMMVGRKVIERWRGVSLKRTSRGGKGEGRLRSTGAEARHSSRSLRDTTSSRSSERPRPTQAPSHTTATPCSSSCPSRVLNWTPLTSKIFPSRRHHSLRMMLRGHPIILSFVEARGEGLTIWKEWRGWCADMGLPRRRVSGAVRVERRVNRRWRMRRLEGGRKAASGE